MLIFSSRHACYQILWRPSPSQSMSRFPIFPWMRWRSFWRRGRGDRRINCPPLLWTRDSPPPSSWIMDAALPPLWKKSPVEGLLVAIHPPRIAKHFRTGFFETCGIRLVLWTFLVFFSQTSSLTAAAPSYRSFSVGNSHAFDALDSFRTTPPGSPQMLLSI